MSCAFYLVQMYHLYGFRCQSVRKQQTDFVFCFVCLEASGEWQCLWSAGVFFPQFIWLGAFVCDPHYNPEIKYTSKQLKLNKIKCATHHRRYMVIEHICICLLISCPATHFHLFFYLNVLSYLYWAAMQGSLFGLCQFKANAILMCWVRPLKATNPRRRVSLKAYFSRENSSLFTLNIRQNEKENRQQNFNHHVLWTHVQIKAFRASLAISRTLVTC